MEIPLRKIVRISHFQGFCCCLDFGCVRRGRGTQIENEKHLIYEGHYPETLLELRCGDGKYSVEDVDSKVALWVEQPMARRKVVKVTLPLTPALLLEYWRQCSFLGHIFDFHFHLIEAMVL